MASPDKARKGSGTLSFSAHGRMLRFVAAVCLWACCAGFTFQVAEKGSFRPSELVELVRLDSTIHLDIRYATTHNFMKRPMYSEARAFLQRPAAEALLRVQARLRSLGFGLLVFDGYRPWSITKKFWDETPAAQRKFVADPSKGSRHNRGCAVDCSLYDLRTGREVRMPSAYDEFSPRASASYAGGTMGERRRRGILRAALVAEGFSIEPDEWWHFDYRDWHQYRVQDIPFSAIH
ncbi:MAG TPA: M15 family metallopeptidase [Bacteroidota bacterium]|nr:M15 family metallopeptidase [Bacteroidota bacterium]